MKWQSLFSQKTYIYYNILECHLLLLWLVHVNFSTPTKIYSYCSFVFVLRFYGPVNPMGSCWAWSVYQTTCLLGRLSPLSGYPVISIMHILLPETDNGRNWQLPFLNQQKGENDHRKYFMINIYERMNWQVYYVHFHTLSYNIQIYTHHQTMVTITLVLVYTFSHWVINF